MAKKTKKVTAPLLEIPQTLSPLGKRLVGTGILVIATGLLVLLETDPYGRNALSYLAPLLILCGYGITTRGIFSTSPDFPNQIDSDNYATTRLAMVLGFLVFILLFGTYLYHLCPTLYARDSGELATASHILGIPHAPGFPTYVLIGKLFDALPLGNPAYRANLMSAFFAALSAAIVYWIIWRHTKSLTSAIFSTLMLGFAASFWKQALVAEAFSLNSAFLVLHLLILAAWLEQPRPSLLWGNALLFGLALGNHQMMIFQLPSSLYALWVRRWGNFTFIIGKALLFFLVGFAIYLYLPFRSSQSPPLNLGQPTSVGRFISVLTRSEYGSLKLSAKKSGTGETFKPQLKIFFKRALDQFTPVGLVLVCIGIFSLWSVNRELGLSLVLSFLTLGPAFVWLAGLPVDADTLALFERFYTASWCPLAILMGIGLARTTSYVSSCSTRGGKLLPILLMGIPFWALRVDMLTLSQRNNFYAYDLMQDIFSGLPQDAIFLTTTDTVTHGTYYLHFVERRRQDLKIIGETAHPPYLYPQLYSADLPENATARQMLSDVTDPVLRTILNTNIDRYPVYIEGIPSGLENFVAPAGLIYRVVKNQGISAKANSIVKNLSLWDLSAQRGGFQETQDPFVRQIFFSYFVAHYNTSILLNLAGLRDQEQNELQKAEYLKKISGPIETYARYSKSLTP